MNLYDEYTDSFKRIFNDDRLSSQMIYSLDEDLEGNIWVGTDNGLNKISKDSDEVIQYFNDQSHNSIG
ncbi:hypothetical protein H9X77_14580 [Clostridium saudiense]|nr:hypothetical protein [Clostridium saudiense]